MTTPTTSLAQRQRDFAGYLISGYPKLGLKGLPSVSACAITGNASVENLCRPVTTGRKDSGSDGILQWRLGRLTAMQSYCVANFGRWDSLEAQAAFTLHEIKSDYPGLSADLIAGKQSLATLTANFCDLYERPAKATENLDGRIRFARDTQALLAQPGPPPPAAHAGAASVVVLAGAAAGGAHWLGGPLWLIALIAMSGAVGAFVIYTHFKSKAALPPLAPPAGPLAKSAPIQEPAASPATITSIVSKKITDPPPKVP